MQIMASTAMLSLGLLILSLLTIASDSAFAQATADCNAAKLAEARDRTVANPDNEWSHRVEVGCRLELEPTDVITKVLIIRGAAASGTTIDCNGALLDGGPGRFNHLKDMIIIRHDSAATRPENVTIRNCRIVGSMRVISFGKNDGAIDALREASKSSTYVDFIRARAPRKILLENLSITGVGKTPLYVAMGVSELTLRNSLINGRSSHATIYLDAESTQNVIRNNVIQTVVADGSTWGFYDRGWPQIAIDGSSHNEIIGNTFSNIVNGGIYFYRNCGESGIIRHSTPSNNRVVNNIFHSPRVLNDPPIFIGSRDYGRLESDIQVGHCDDDEDHGVKIGSAKSNADFARNNVIVQNQFFASTITIRNKPIDSRPNRRVTRELVSESLSESWSESLSDSATASARRMETPALDTAADRTGPIATRPRPRPGNGTKSRAATLKDFIRTRNRKVNSPSYIEFNEIVDRSTVDETRLAGCYLLPERVLVKHGDTLARLTEREATACYSNFPCEDGEVTRAKKRDCRVKRVSLDCSASGDNAGCETTVACPAGTRIVGAKAACNLEYGTIGLADVDRLSPNQLSVIRKSDNVAEGACFVSFNRISQGSTRLTAVSGWPRLAYGCKEKDKNGGDCHIRGVAYCL